MSTVQVGALMGKEWGPESPDEDVWEGLDEAGDPEPLDSNRSRLSTPSEAEPSPPPEDISPPEAEALPDPADSPQAPPPWPLPPL